MFSSLLCLIKDCIHFIIPRAGIQYILMQFFILLPCKTVITIFFFFLKHHFNIHDYYHFPGESWRWCECDWRPGGVTVHHDLWHAAV